MKYFKHKFVMLSSVILLNFLSIQAQQSNSVNSVELLQYGQLNSNNFFIDSNNLNNLKTSDFDSVVVINQLGTNDLDLKLKQSDSQIVNQIGKENYYQFINYYNNSPTSFNIAQKGDSNSIQIYGSNSIVEKLGIVQTGSYRSVIIKNY